MWYLIVSIPDLCTLTYIDLLQIDIAIEQKVKNNLETYLMLQWPLCLVIHLGHFWLICCAKLSLDLIDDLDLIRMDIFMRISPFNLNVSIQQYK